MDFKAAHLPRIYGGVALLTTCVALACALMAITLLQTCRLNEQTLASAQSSALAAESSRLPDLPEPALPQPQCNCTGAGVAQTRERYTVAPYQLMGPLQWEEVPSTMRRDYTLGDRVPVQLWWFNDAKPLMEGAASQSTDGVVAFDSAAIERMMQEVREDRPVCRYGQLCHECFRDALKMFNASGKSVVILGSETPWAEAYYLAAGAASVVTTDYRDPSYRHPRLRFLHVQEMSEGDELFDMAVSFSSFEHDGLGRYGDPLGPNADLIRMEQAKNILKPGGLMFLGVPNGKDFLVFNAHRVYGPIRFPMLVKGWKQLHTFGGNLEELYETHGDATFEQILHVMTPE